MNVVRLDPEGHRRVQRLLVPYVGGRLGAAECAEVEQHVAGCPRCHAELDAVRRLHAPAAAPARRPVPWWRWALGAQTVLIGVLGALLLADRPAPYRGLGTPAATAPANAIVMFSPHTPEAAVRRALQASQGQIVGGPTATGAWLVALPEADADALAQLRRQPGVALAESLQPGAGR